MFLFHSEMDSGPVHEHPSHVEKMPTESLLNVARCFIAIIAAAWITEAFWLGGASWCDGPPGLDYFAMNFQIPLALGLVAGAKLAGWSESICRGTGIVSLLVCAPAFALIVMASLRGQRVWVYANWRTYGFW